MGARAEAVSDLRELSDPEFFARWAAWAVAKPMLNTKEAAQMIDLAVKPLHELEAALEAAETLLKDHKGLLADELAAQLSSLHSGLTVVINDHYGIADDAEQAGNLADKTK